MSVPASTATKTRSPNYPSIGLVEAIDRVRSIYETQQRYPSTREVLAKLMGYKSLSGASASMISALGKYGLLEGQGDNLRITEIGQDLILHRQGDPEYSEALREAAFRPAFFRELRDQYPSGLPSDHSLRATLTKRGFNPKAIDGALRPYRETMDFLETATGNATQRGSAQDETGAESRVIHAPNQGNEQNNVHPVPGQRVVSLPLPMSEWATLQAPFPLTEAAWEQMIAVLNAMKPALIIRSGPAPSPSARGPLEADDGSSQPSS